MSDVLSASAIRVRYDRDSDVLYVTTRPGVPARSREEQPGVIWRFDAKNGELIGVTVMDFATYWGPRRPELVGYIADRFGMTKRQVRDALEPFT